MCQHLFLACLVSTWDGRECFHLLGTNSPGSEQAELPSIRQLDARWRLRLLNPFDLGRILLGWRSVNPFAVRWAKHLSGTGWAQRAFERADCWKQAGGRKAHVLMRCLCHKDGSSELPGGFQLDCCLPVMRILQSEREGEEGRGRS